jgi:DNA mismatch repair protein MutL
LAVIYIELDPRLVDVNVHPRKAEVRFAQERVVYQALSRAVEKALSPYPILKEALTIAWPFEGLPFEVVREAGPGYFIGRLEALGQIGGAFIVAKSHEGLVIVDQHAAHEQALFERLLQGGKSHTLTPPVRVEVTSHEAELLTAHLGLLTELGLEVEPFGGNCFLIRSLPPVVAGKEPAEVLTVLIEEIERSQQLDEEALRERLTLKAACFAAFKAGDFLSSEEMQEVLDGLSATWSPSTCPHGRPSFFILTLEEMERRLMRR